MQSANSKRAMSKKTAIENEIARHKNVALVKARMSYCGTATLMSAIHMAITQLNAMQQIPHWCFRKNRPELEPRLYNRWLKSQAKAGVRVISGK